MNIRDMRPFLLALYLVGVVLIIATVLEPALRIWPLHPGDTRWRFGAVGFMANATAGVLFGLGWLMAIAAVLEHRGTMRSIAVLSGVLGIAALLLVPIFGLDFLQLRASVRPIAVGGFTIAAAQALLLLVLSGVSALILGIAGWKATRRRGDARAAATSGILRNEGMLPGRVG